MAQQEHLGGDLPMVLEQLPAVPGLHGQNEVGLPYQRGGEGLGPVLAEIDSVLLGHERGKVGRRISWYGDKPRGPYLDVPYRPLLEESAEKPFRHGTPADVSGADEEHITYGGDGTVHGPLPDT
jgi:hypothetical protein